MIKLIVCMLALFLNACLAPKNYIEKELDSMVIFSGNLDDLDIKINEKSRNISNSSLEEITYLLESGIANITLTRNGKILLNRNYYLNKDNPVVVIVPN